MSKWVGKFTCPGFCCVPRKPWPLSNENHTIACGVSGALYYAKLVKGRGEPKDDPAKEYCELGKNYCFIIVSNLFYLGNQ